MEIRIRPDSNKTLFQILQEKNIYMPALCAGRGTCGKCRVKVLKGHVPITDADRRFFSEKELQEGFVLSCKCIPTKELLIEAEDSKEEFIDVLGVSKTYNEYSINEAGQLKETILGIDIGTTTIAMALADFKTGEIVDEYLTINNQRMYGADVISRIQASIEGKGDELKACIRKSLWKGISLLARKNNVIPGQIVIAGNTTMIHLLMGYPCNTLGVAPFTPYNINEIKGSAEDILGTAEDGTENLYQIPVRILPGMSAFVGADIVADMMLCKLAQAENVSVLIDLGTNGEMVIGNKDRILVTSAAAGPAFEGGNITHGIGSVPGAICGIELSGEEIKLKTIRDEAPVGICGTGTIEIVHELLDAGIIDETGYMESEEFVLAKKSDGNNVSFFRKDVRELQLAKAAIRAGLETLLLRYGIKAEEVSTVYLAGGFGYHINVHKAISIGLIPKEFTGKIKVIGNGSLLGAIMCGAEETESESKTMLGRMAETVSEINLALDAEFNELYMKYMFFEK